MNPWIPLAAGAVLGLLGSRVVAWARRPSRTRLNTMREAARRPGPGYRELFVDGVPSGWLKPSWRVPEHGLIVIRARDGFPQARVVFENESGVWASRMGAECGHCARPAAEEGPHGQR
jgi:hypothetical protein